MYRFFILFLCLVPPIARLHAQLVIHGRVLDTQTSETVIGARVLINDTDQGTITDLDGEFHLSVEQELPIRVHIQSVGFQDVYVFVADSSMYVEVSLLPNTGPGKAVVVSASRVEESILEAPVSISQMNFLDFRYHPNPEIYGALAQMEGVVVNTSSLNYQSVNTRAFGNVQNWRFVQFVDGMDISGPGVNYAVGTALRGTELDIAGIEVVPGAGSALYGANAFNGILSTTSRNPFDYPGMSAYVRQGVMQQTAELGNPFYEVGFRYAKAFDDKWAIKVNLQYLDAQEWAADDNSYLITNADIPFKDQLLATPASSPNFNSVNRYGDEVVANVRLNDSTFIPVNRTGIQEGEIISGAAQKLFVQASLHYRLTPTVEASYDFRTTQSDAIIRYENFYPFENYKSTFHKFQLTGDNFLIRTYFANDDAGEAYSMLAAGAIVQEGIKSTANWSQDYGAALRGEVPGIVAGDHAASRLFADRDLVQPGDARYETLLSLTRAVPIDINGGSAVEYEASFVHADAIYDLSKEIDFVDIQIGGSARRYLLNSKGHVYNDGPLGFGGPIDVVEYGAFAQATKSLMDDRLLIRGSIRYDKNQAFDGRFTPRGSLVWLLGREKEHAFRASAQTGFRNPANQDTYVAFNAGPLIYLGNIQANVENFSYRAADEVIYSGADIYQNLVTFGSFLDFQSSGGTDPSLLQPANLQYLKQEQITTFEIGYRALIVGKLYGDVQVYHNRYDNFTANVVTISPQAQVPFLLLTNISETVTSTGAGVSLDGELPGGFRVGANYTYTEYDAAKAQTTNPNYFPDFNTPKNMVKVNVGNRDVAYGLGFQLRYRWQDSYTFQSPNGQGKINEYQVLDAALTYRLSPVKCLLKVGAANLFRQAYTTVYGGPQIGGTYYVQITFDEWLEGAPRR
ncbi:MAG: TonB-dependent receptor [Bacteroidia bacterium]|nr:TonB-dependent receptor [Bacteroidia bacterium]